MRDTLRRLSFATGLALAASATAQDATFLPTDSISVQGGTSTPDELTIECRAWIPSSMGPVLGLPGYSGYVFMEQRDSVVGKFLAIGPDGVACALETVMGAVHFAVAMPTDQWCHVAMVRSGTAVTIYVNGSAIGTSPCRAGPIRFTSSPDLRIGAPVHNGIGYAGRGFTGRLDWLRVSSVARYAGGFAVPDESSLMPADAGTELLLRFNDAAGGTSVVDDGVHHFATVLGDTARMPGATAPRLAGAAACPRDLDGNTQVDMADVALLLLEFGPCE